MKAGMPSNSGRPSLIGPGRLEHVDLSPYRRGRRRQRLVFEMARDLTRSYCDSPDCAAPAHTCCSLNSQPSSTATLTRRCAPSRRRKRSMHSSRPGMGGSLERLLEAIHPEADDADQDRVTALRDQPRARIYRRGRLRDQARALPGDQEPRQRRGARHRQVGAIGVLPDRSQQAREVIRPRTRGWALPSPICTTANITNIFRTSSSN